MVSPILLHFLALAAAPLVQSEARVDVVLAEHPAPDGVAHGEFPLAARGDGSMVAWIDGQGALLSLTVLDAGGEELARDEPGRDARPARVELPLKEGERVTVLWEAREARPWGWIQVGARAARESDATRAAAGRAKAALARSAQLAAAGDPEGQREVLAEAIGELLSLPDTRESRLLADALWSLTYPTFSAASLEPSLAAAVRVLDHRTRFEPPTARVSVFPRMGMANILGDLAQVEEARRNYAFVEAQLARSRPSDDTDLAMARLNWANSLRRLGELEAPAVLIAAAVEVYECRLPKDSAERKRAESVAAELDLAMGRVEEARERMRELYRDALASGDEWTIQVSAGNYAIALTQSGELERAREIEEANLLRGERRLPSDHRDLVLMRENLGVSLMNLGDLPRARSLLEAAFAPFEDDPGRDPLGAMYVLSNLGELERRAGNLPRARELLERALELARAVQDADDAVLPLNALAQTMLAEGEFDRAQASMERLVAARIASAGEAGLYTQSARLGLADCLMARGDHAGATELAETALAHLRAKLPATDVRIFDARILLVLARLRGGDGARAADLLAAWQADLASHLARESLNGSPRFVEERAHSRRDQVGASIAIALELGAEKSLASQALALLETSRASSLWAADALRLARTSRDAESARAELTRLARELSRASAQSVPDAVAIARLTAAKDASEASLVAGLAASSATVRWGEPLDLARVRAALGPADAALSYSTLGEAPGAVGKLASLAAFVLRAQGEAQLFDLGPREPIEAAIAAWRRALGTEGQPALSAAAQREAGEDLRRRVFDPLRASLRGVQRLFVVLDGALHLVALDALPDGERVLGDSLSLRTLPSLAALAPRTARGAPGDHVVLIGGLDYGAGALPALAGSLAEVERVAEIHRGAGGNVRVLSAHAADRDSFASALAEARILHVATHGELVPGTAAPARSAHRAPVGLAQVRELSPLSLCGLALSGANERQLDGERPGFVRGVELSSLDASGCELVVLSACESRAGVARPGLAVASLEKAMHLAGARSVLASLWQVDDAESRELMVAFHRGLVEQGRSPAEALWEAKKLLRARRLPARAWAGWVLSSADAGSLP